MPIPKEFFKQLKQLVPPLDGSLHKGQSGRVGILGGALDYTGAPFFASMSAYRLGADLSHVICSPTAAGAIKSYAPDLIVHPILREEADEQSVRQELESLLSRLHALVIGPGLGREPYMQKYAKMAIGIARQNGMNLVLDADSLLIVGSEPETIRGYRRVILTPNVVEFKRLGEAVQIDPNAKAEDRASLISRALGGVLVVQKGSKDILAIDATGEAADAAASKVSDDARERVKEQIEIDTEGSPRRCGGQGDILGGTMGAILAWGKCYEDGAFGDKSVPTSKIPLLAAAGACMVTRTASKLAFAEAGRSMATQDMLGKVAAAFREVFEEDVTSKPSKM
jgi:ATP-dependent NAD(P)H-hydrate dehydratase